MVKCPKCGAPMPGTAQCCNKCKADLKTAPAPESAAQNPSCPVCGAELQPRWKVCPECGSAVPPAIPVCRKCGAELKPHWKACPECGTPASAPEPAAVQTEAAPEQQARQTSAAPARVEMRQEKDANYIQAQPAALPSSTMPANQFTPTVQTLGADEKYCFSCGSPIKKAAEMCPKCGVLQGLSAGSGYPPGYAPKEHTTALLLCIFFGTVGGHRFYVGKIGTAILIILSWITLGIVPAIWWIIDLVQICAGKFTDKQGYPLKKK